MLSTSANGTSPAHTTRAVRHRGGCPGPAGRTRAAVVPPSVSSSPRVSSAARSGLSSQLDAAAALTKVSETVTCAAVVPACWWTSERSRPGESAAVAHSITAQACSADACPGRARRVAATVTGRVVVAMVPPDVRCAAPRAGAATGTVDGDVGYRSGR
jgi:hypothetical protein